MDLIADILLAAGALGAGFYCLVLSRRLKRFNDLEKGVGGAVAVLSSQVEDLNKSFASARQITEGSSQALDQLTGRAESVAQRLELMMASMHDLPEVAPEAAQPPRAAVTRAEESDALAVAYETEAAPEPEVQVEDPNKSAGVMFVRHNRDKNRVA
ncbi:hypothetical protein [Phaeobacter sp. 11ANDIMAR09]|uniref:hypothetical protein n=1 Tax=Phaeobacter sp. 11ANDIMAR09 TaxID=1225647 RepID=UPI0006C831DD|nr:hypothetical protein [Phaeobacter sp. 11ANDIMAR09]KPD14322.1 hypothetical protein AN476_00875 [Phaeobacter sp. 11ANDIMAR09]OIQ34290.1 MAG: hypothetical protein BM559_06890 [Roseobacter sp. MedPE-SWchi]